MAKVFAFPMGPANYTIDIIENVYKSMGINYAFVHGSSEASDEGCRGVLVLGETKGWYKLFSIIWPILKKNDIFIVNSYTDKISLLIILINIFFFKKPMGISSDTQLRIPKNIFRRVVKYILLGFLFRRKFIYGLPGGTKYHVDMFRYYGMSASRITVLPMMVNNAKYFRKYIETPQDVFRFVYVGRLIPCKRVKEIIKAYGKLKSAIKNIELHIIGDGIEREDLERLSNGLHVVFHGRLCGEHLIRQFHKMHCLVLYSSFEQWGLVVNEALASGIPCIVSKEVGARFDLVQKEPVTGIVADEGSDSLSEAMKEFVLNKKLWKSCSDNALKRMSAWDYEKYKKQIECFVIQSGGTLYAD